MSHYIPHSITLAELAEAIGIKVAQVEAECRELDVFLGQDWAGQVAVAEVDAEQLVSGHLRQTRADEAEWARHLRDCESWTRTRDELVRSTQRDTELAEQRVGRGGPAAASAGLEAARAVGADYEAANPPPLWRGEECGNARRLFSDGGKPAGLFDKTRALLAGSPR